MAKLQITQLLTDVPMPNHWITPIRYGLAKVGTDAFRTLVHALYRCKYEQMNLAGMYFGSMSDLFYICDCRVDGLGPYLTHSVDYEIDNSDIYEFRYYYSKAGTEPFLYAKVEHEHFRQCFLLFRNIFYRIHIPEIPGSMAYMNQLALILEKLGRTKHV